MSKVIIILILFSSILISKNKIIEKCKFKEWKTYKKTKLLKHKTKSAYIYRSKDMRVSADGAPNAYHKNNKLALNPLANAGYKGGYWGILTNKNGIPYKQKSGKFKGYYISTTWLEDYSKKKIDINRYVDASKIPYIVFPKKFYKMLGVGGKGDFGFAINLKTGKSSPFIVADLGPLNAPLGEVSIALAKNLGGKKINLRNGCGIPKGKILYIIFPNSHNKHRWNGSLKTLTKKANNLLKDIGGINLLLKCK